MGFKQTVLDIKSLKIQGAENIAKEAVKSLAYVLEDNRKKEPVQTIKALEKAKTQLFATRATEPCMRNALNFVLADVSLHTNTTQDLKTHVESKIKNILDFFQESEEKIIEYGAQKIKDGMIVYTHCHSSTVTRILKRAWKNGKHFEVHNTETRPRFQGRVTATELAKAGIHVTHYVDSAARFALKKADLMLIGADAITVEGKVINKIGSELFAEIAERYDVPVYVCANSWKFDPATVFGFEEPIEKRYASEVWKDAPRGVKIDNFAFEKISPELITGIVTELGIYKPQMLADIVQKKYAWMFRIR